MQANFTPISTEFILKFFFFFLPILLSLATAVFNCRHRLDLILVCNCEFVYEYFFLISKSQF